jgi:hypothetical protein
MPGEGILPLNYESLVVLMRVFDDKKHMYNILGWRTWKVVVAYTSLHSEVGEGHYHEFGRMRRVNWVVSRRSRECRKALDMYSRKECRADATL